MNSQSLSGLTRIYWETPEFGPGLDEYLRYFQKLDSLDDVIRFACHGRDGKIHGHQHLVGKEKLEQARKQLQKCVDEIKACESFDDLLNCVHKRTQAIRRFGVLAVYDTTLRLGAHLKRWPKVVYLHAGTRKGCRALGVAARGSVVEMNKFPKEVQVLEPHHVENFLCIFKDQFTRSGGKVKGCGPKGDLPKGC